VLKHSLCSVDSVGALCTGGRVVATADGCTVFTCCNDVVQVVAAETL
jgi:hypothetical protein